MTVSSAVKWKYVAYWAVTGTGYGLKVFIIKMTCKISLILKLVIYSELDRI